MSCKPDECEQSHGQRCYRVADSVRHGAERFRKGAAGKGGDQMGG